MKQLPELDAYRERLLERAAAWSERAPADLRREIDECLRQTDLLDRALAGLRVRVAASAEPAEAGEASDRAAAEEAGTLEHRIAVQAETRDLTAAYAEALRRHLAGR